MGNEKQVIVIPVELGNEIYKYLNSKPRVETNALCLALEKAPSLDESEVIPLFEKKKEKKK